MNISKADMKRLTDAIKETHKIMMDDLKKNFKLVDQGDVDSIPWYTVQIQNQEIWFWLTQQGFCGRLRGPVWDCQSSIEPMFHPQ